MVAKDGKLFFMDCETKAFSWLGNLRDQFNTFCSEADEIIPQEPITYVQNQLLTAGENLKQFCAEFVTNVLPTFITSSLEEDSPLSPKQREKTRKTSDMTTDDDQEMTPNIANSPSPPLLSAELVGGKCVDNQCQDSVLISSELNEAGKVLGGHNLQRNKCNFYIDSSSAESSVVHSSENSDSGEGVKLSTEFRVCELPNDDASSWSTEAIQTNDFIGTGCNDTVEILEPKFVETLSDSGHDQLEKVCTQLVCEEKLEDGDDFCSDTDIKEDCVSYQETNVPTVEKKKFDGKSQGINLKIVQASLENCEQQEQDEESTLSDEDDWEIIRVLIHYSAMTCMNCRT